MGEKATKTKFTIKKDNYQDFIDKLDDLTKIGDSIKLKIDEEDIFMYSMMSSGHSILSFKNYLMKTKDYFEFKNNFDTTISIIIPSAKKFVKNLNFTKESEKIILEISSKVDPDDDNILLGRSLQVVGDKIKINWMSGENYEMRDLDKSFIEKKLDLVFRKWFFNINKSEFTDVKKLSSINSDRIINISILDGKVILSEKAAWEFEIGSIDESRSADLKLNKKFLNCINDTEVIEFSIYDNFMLIKDDNSNLMLSYEQDFSDDI